MSKRRLTKQQTLRVQQQQTDPTLKTGLVITRLGRYALIEDENNTVVHCNIRPNLQSIVAGDRIFWQPEGLNQGIIISLSPRDSLLARVNANGQAKPIAANITQICVVVAPKPKLSWILLDSYLIMAECLHIPACIILNKMDLASIELQQQIQTIYQALDYPILLTGVDYPEGDESLTQQLKHQTSIFVGQSGVGKSSLIERMLPHRTDIQTGALSDKTDLGCHTTSRTTLYHLPAGGALVDSPGVRAFDLTHLKTADLAHGFPEFSAFITQCKFRNCNHMDTPQCAIIQAVHDGIISTHRYQNYVRLNTPFSTG